MNRPQTDHQEFLISEYVNDRIDFRVRSLAEWLEIPHQDHEDLRQRMRLELIIAMRRFDVSVARRETFVNRVLDCLVKYLLREGIAALDRDAWNPTSLDALEGEFPVTNDEVSSSNLSEQQLTDLQIDVREIIATLPAELRETARALMYGSIREAARKLGVSATTVTRRMRIIRRVFEQAGFSNPNH